MTESRGNHSRSSLLGNCTVVGLAFYEQSDVLIISPCLVRTLSTGRFSHSQSSPSRLRFLSKGEDGTLSMLMKMLTQPREHGYDRQAAPGLNLTNAFVLQRVKTHV